MSEAIRLLAQEKGLSEDALLHVLVDALASAYKRRDGAADEVVVEVNPETMEFTFTAYDLDEDGNWVNERDDTPRREELGRIAAQTFRQVMSQRIREVEQRPQVRGVRQPRGRHRHWHHPAHRQPLHAARPRSRRGVAPPGRAGAIRAAPAGRPGEGLHRRGAQDRQGSADRGESHTSRPDQTTLRAGGTARSPMASWRSRRVPASRDTARRSPCGRTITTSIPSAPASPRAAVACGWSSTRCAARRSTSFPTARTSPTSSPRRCRRRRSTR